MSYEYRYDSQFQNYIAQFLRVFSGFQYVKDSEGNLERIPVHYGPQDRIVAKIINKRQSFPNTKIPLIAGVMSGIEKNPERKRATDYSGSVSLKLNSDGSYTTLERLIGPSFTINMDVAIIASSTEQLFEIVEQILLVFNPRVSIQLSEDVKDQNYNTEISLEGINNEINYPLGTENKFVSMTLNFSMEARLDYPQKFNDSIIEKIITNLYDNTIENDPQKLSDFEVDVEDVEGDGN